MSDKLFYLLEAFSQTVKMLAFWRHDVILLLGNNRIAGRANQGDGAAALEGDGGPKSTT